MVTLSFLPSEYSAGPCKVIEIIGAPELQREVSLIKSLILIE